MRNDETLRRSGRAEPLSARLSLRSKPFHSGPRYVGAVRIGAFFCGRFL